MLDLFKLNFYKNKNKKEKEYVFNKVKKGMKHFPSSVRE